VFFNNNSNKYNGTFLFIMINKFLEHLRKILPKSDVLVGHMFLWGGALLVGLISVIFASLGDMSTKFFKELVANYSWLPFIITPLGLCVSVMLTKAFFPAVSGSGIPQAIAAKSMRVPAEKVRLLSVKNAFVKIFLTVLAILCGASVGREGPTVQVGASIMMGVGRLFSYGTRSTLVIAGGAAGIAAAFNTPLAGIVFAVEELSRTYVQKTTSLIVSTVIIAGASSLALKGNYTYFGKMSAEIGEPVALIAILLCGIVCGALGGIFGKMVIGLSSSGKGKIAGMKKKSPVAFAFICGLIIAIVGYLSCGTSFGTGYDEARGILEGKDELPALYSLYKVISLFCSYVSGIPGGIFAPSLAVGAGIGRDVSSFFPDVAPQAIALLGMAAFLSAVVQSPITAFVIVMEMSDDHEILLPLMAVSLIAAGVSKIFCPDSLYHALSKGFIKPQKGDKSVLNIGHNFINFVLGGRMLLANIDEFLRKTYLSLKNKTLNEGNQEEAKKTKETVNAKDKKNNNKTEATKKK
jgi:H+/Cl- antiporter ClcA